MPVPRECEDRDDKIWIRLSTAVAGQVLNHVPDEARMTACMRVCRKVVTSSAKWQRYSERFARRRLKLWRTQ
jgi:hypothetical protein